MEKIETVTSEVLKNVKPSEEEKVELKALAKDVIESVDKAASDLNVDAFGMLVGSTARDTWISGEKDIDVFIMLPTAMSREELESAGLTIAKNCAPEYEERYAEHPYIRAKFGGYDVDIVPCFRVEDPSEIRSAVDRTPFHNEYIKREIRGLEDEVLLLKQFMRGVGVYGAELKIHGFSGYLCELLILKYRSFSDVVKSSSDWKFGETIDIKGTGTYEGDDPLIVIDPVDPNRNVAAAVSLDSYSRFIDASRSFMCGPDISYFFPPPVSPISKEDLARVIEERGTELIAIVLDVPDMVDDLLFPQLYKAERSVLGLLKRLDFCVFNSGVWAEGLKAVILLEMEVSELPKIKKILGPPVTLKDRGENFKKKHETYPISIENGRYVAEIPRKYKNVVDLLEGELLSCSLGKNISASLESYEILTNEKILFEGFDQFLGGYFKKNQLLSLNKDKSAMNRFIDVDKVL
ncbi:MAG: CCA tRNA nucleotidyltransferase [Halobacteriota archaeon]|nr:CCA tRNA nucleotidyltransferase [Halobacteriota archaeon]